MYQSIDKEHSKTKGALLGATAISLLFGSAYFLYSGAYGTQTPLHSFFTDDIIDSTDEIRIEYSIDDMPEGIKPNSAQWVAYHNELLTAAGYDADALRNNPDADVSFIAYDGIDDNEDTLLNADFGDQPGRKSIGITCYTEYREFGKTGNQKCKPTRKIAHPIRTGCSSLGSGLDILGTFPMGSDACRSHSEHERISARCCQPTPGTVYEDASFVVSHQFETEETGKCASTECGAEEIMVACQGSLSESKKSESVASGFGGALTVSNSECRVQRDGGEGSITADALCAAQPASDDFNLRCFAVNSGDAIADEDGFVSSVQCPRGKVMFDCTSYINRRTDDCDGEPVLESEDLLNGEYFFKANPRSKVFCEGVGDSNKVRVQATCCEYLEEKGPGLDA